MLLFRSTAIPTKTQITYAAETDTSTDTAATSENRNCSFYYHSLLNDTFLLTMIFDVFRETLFQCLQSL